MTVASVKDDGPGFEIVVVSPEEHERTALFPNEVSTIITSACNRDAEQVLAWADAQESLPVTVICFVASLRAGFAGRLLAWQQDVAKIRAEVEAALDTADAQASAPTSSSASPGEAAERSEHE